MPDEEGNLAEAESTDIIRKLAERGIKGTCPECSKDGTALLRKVVWLRSTNLGQGYPQVLVTCDNCGYTRLFNAFVLGIPEKEKWGKDGE